MSNKIKVSLVDDEFLFRKGISTLIEPFDNIEVISEAEDGRAFLDYLKSNVNHPDIVLLDLQMADMNGIETSRILVREYPDIKIVILSSHFSSGMVYNMLEIGVAAYLVKNSTTDEVRQTIQEVYKNGFYYSSEIQNIINQSLKNNKKPKRAEFNVEITSREKEILKLICDQHTNVEIAKQLYISVRTVDGHRNNLLKKFNRKNTAGLVAYAVKRQLVVLDPSSY